MELIIVQGEDLDGNINDITANQDNPFTGKLGETSTAKLGEVSTGKLSASLQRILDEDVAMPDQTEIDAINLQSLKDRFEQIRKDLMNQ